MKKTDFTGWQHAFSFAFEQAIKQKAFIVFMVIGCIVALFLKPAITFFGSLSEDEADKKTEVQTLTVYDESGLGIDYNEFLDSFRYQDVEIVTADVSEFDANVERLKSLSEKKDDQNKNAEKNMELLVHITYEEGIFNMNFVKSAVAGINSDDGKQFVSDFKDYFTNKKLKAIEVTEEQMAFIAQTVESKVVFTDETGAIITDDDNEGISMEEYGALLGLLMVVIMIVSFCGGTIANSIVVEKSTKVIEYLMINIRPMALITGKILACLCSVVIQFGSMLICFGISGIVETAMFGTKETAEGSVDMIGETVSMLAQVSVDKVVLCFLMMLGSIMFFCILAGVSGASVSKIEELAEGIKNYNMIMIVGAYASMAIVIFMLTGSVSTVIINVFSVLPVFSAFLAPGMFLIGKIGYIVAIISFIVTLISVYALFRFASNVFEALIFHNGSVMKFKDIMGIAKSKKMNREAK